MVENFSAKESGSSMLSQKPGIGHYPEPLQFTLHHKLFFTIRSIVLRLKVAV